MSERRGSMNELFDLLLRDLPTPRSWEEILAEEKIRSDAERLDMQAHDPSRRHLPGLVSFMREHDEATDRIREGDERDDDRESTEELPGH